MMHGIDLKSVGLGMGVGRVEGMCVLMLVCVGLRGVGEGKKTQFFFLKCLQPVSREYFPTDKLA